MHLILMGRPTGGTVGSPPNGAVFIFYIFIFYKNIFSFSKFTGIYPGRPAAGPPGRGAAGAFLKKIRGENCAQVPGGRPAAGRSGGRPWPPGCGATGPPTLYKVLAVPHPLICLTKNPEKKKREGGREGEAKRRSPAGFSSRRL